MDYLVILVLIVLSFVWTCIHVLKSGPSCRKSCTASLPPGPYPFPIIGNIFEIGKKPHQSLANLSKTYGPLMSLKLGSITTIVISSSKTAKEVLHQNDQVFSNRTIPDDIRALDHHKVSVAWMPVSAQWRNLRKICAVQLFSVQRLNASQPVRQKKVQELLAYVHENCNSGRAIDIGRAAFTTSLNTISNTLFSSDLAHYHSDLSQEFKDLLWDMREQIGKPNLVDYFPILGLIDPQGRLRWTTFYFKRFFAIFDDIISRRSQLRGSSTSSANNDVLDALLNLSEENNSEFSYNDIKHLLLDLIVGATDTTSSTLEWAMTELLHNPETMAKTRTELKEVIGKDRQIQESDISKLPYLQAVVKESFRLHPAGPLLVPHKAETDVEICGYRVPKNAQILVNIWAIGRDPSIWLDPNSFVPERFLDSEIDVKGRDFELIPFGAGKRICPGLPLALRMLHLMLASLLHSFDWKLEEGIKPEDMDMTDKFGITLHKAEPSRAIPIKA